MGNRHDGGVYDPDEHERAVREITPERFGVIVASTILDDAGSQSWSLAHKAIETETGWFIEHEDLEAFLERIASGDRDD